MNEQIAKYIRENQGRYTKEAITSQLIAAGHDVAAIEESWAVVNAAAMAEAESAGPRARYRPVTLGLTAIGAVLTFVIWWEAATYFTFAAPVLATVSYVVAVLVVMGVGIGLTRAAMGGAWIAVVALGVIGTGWLLWMAVADLQSDYRAVFAPLEFAAAVATFVATIVAFVLGRRGAHPAALVYALPVLGWLAITGYCVSPLLGAT